MNHWVVWNGAGGKHVGELIAFDNPVALVTVVADATGDVKPARLVRINVDHGDIRIFNNYSDAGAYYRSV